MTVGGRTLRRNPLPHEVQASVDWDAMEEAWQTERDDVTEQWLSEVQPELIAALLLAIEAAETLDQLAALAAPVLGEQVIADAMFALAEEAGAQAVAEAGAQGVELDPFDSEKVADEIAVRASAQATVMAGAISQAASQKAIAEAGTGLTMDEVAERVDDHLSALSDSYPRDQLGGVLMQAQNAARRAVFEDAPNGRYVASELLDGNTCTNCKDVDGKEYDSIEATIQDSPSGGFHMCLGGPRCRGTIIYIAAE